MITSLSLLFNNDSKANVCNWLMRVNHRSFSTDTVSQPSLSFYVHVQCDSRLQWIILRYVLHTFSSLISILAVWLIICKANNKAWPGSTALVHCSNMSSNWSEPVHNNCMANTYVGIDQLNKVENMYMCSNYIPCSGIKIFTNFAIL